MNDNTPTSAYVCVSERACVRACVRCVHMCALNSAQVHGVMES
jgi:hypothetical protein